ncbi:MAG: tetratricopeptide repeat protein [Prevotella sp.]|nr:tetratricopeptide repeat protein [Prevotella sp.]
MGHREDGARVLLWLVVAALIVQVPMLLLSGCSTEKNTAQTRFWHSFTANYNTYYNGAQAYIEGSLAKEKGNVDNFTEMIPLYTVGNKKTREVGKSNFDRAIEKSQKAIKQHSIRKRPEWTKNRKKTARDIEWLNRREYNPFLWKAWMLMGRSQFYKGAFDEAASTFAYMSRIYQTQPAIYGKARAWLAKCYIEQDWLYDAEDVINKMNRDSLDWRAKKEWDYTFADYYLHTGRLQEAVPYLKKVIKHEMRKTQRAREWYLLGQVQAALGDKKQAYKAFHHVATMNPPYELEFNARIAMSEVMAGGSPKKMISRLKRMAASDKNAEYLDQVYYAMGNIYLAQKDTTHAIWAYERGNEKATRSGIEKGVLLLHLGDLYWQMEKFSDARRCYGEAIGLLDKERDDYEQLSQRSKVLDELVPYTEAVHLQDSLQWLAKLPEKERFAAIDRVIEELKKKEKEEKKKQQEAEAEQQLQQQEGRNGRTQTTSRQQQTQNPQERGLWYFYNQMAVNQGKQEFQRLWGKRENVDDWQRVNKTVVASAMGAEEMTDEMRDSLARAVEIEDSLKQTTDSAQNDPHKREYYLAQIPFTEEQVEASNLIIMDGLFNSGVIFKDKLDMLALSEQHLRRLADNYPDFEKMDEAYYHLWLLYQRKKQPQTADIYLNNMKAKWPESDWTRVLSDPYFEENARFGEHLEDSLYAATYDAFKTDRFEMVQFNSQLSESRFPMGNHRPKFIFISGLSKLNAGDGEGCLKDMQTVVDKYGQSEVSAMAGMIINGVKGGRKLHGGKFDMGDVWARRSVVMSDSDSIAARKFEVERNTDFVFMIVYQPDSLNEGSSPLNPSAGENQLLFEMARFNFTSFLVRNFDIEIEDADQLRRMRISGFGSYDEVLQYARQLLQNEAVARLARKGRIVLISTKNLELLGTQFSYNDYEEFYKENFIPLKISTVQLLTEPATIEYEKQPEPPAQEEEEGDDMFNGNDVEDTTIMDIGEDVDETDTDTEVTDDQPQPVETPQQPAPAIQRPTVEEPVPVAEEPEEETVVDERPQPAPDVQQPVPAPQEPAPATQEDDDGFIIEDTTEESDDFDIIDMDDTPTSSDKPASTDDDIIVDDGNGSVDDDEYIDFDGF